MNLRPLFAYLPWHARDLAVRVFSPFLLFFVMAGLPLWSITSTQGIPLFGGDPQVQDLALQIWSNTASLCLTIGAVLLMNGSVGVDREKQYVRFLFAHQIPPVWFYLQRFVVGLTLFAVSFALVPVAFSQIVAVPVLGTVLALVLVSFFIGSLMLLLGAISQSDGLLFILVYLVSNVIQAITFGGNGPTWLHGLAWILPPVRQLGEFSGAWLTGRTVEPTDLVLVVSYAIGMLLSGLFLIKRAPLVR